MLHVFCASFLRAKRKIRPPFHLRPLRSRELGFRMISSSQIFIDHSSEPVAVEHYDASQSISNTISDDYLLKMSAREVGQIAADLPSDQVRFTP